jgi:hypothetical protein
MIEKKDKYVRLNAQEMTLGRLLARGISGGPNMTDCPTTEMLSEFIDGKLSHESREKVAAHCGDCEVCYSVVSESLMIREELNSRSRARVKKTLTYSIPAALAAAAVLLVVFKMVQPAPEFSGKPERELSYQDTPVEKKPLPMPDIAIATRSFAGELADRLAGNNTDLLAQIAGRQCRPDSTLGFSSVVTPQKAAFGIGAGLVDHELALKAKDQNIVEVFEKKLKDLLKPFESSYGVAPAITEQGRTSERAGKEVVPDAGFSRDVETFFKNRKEAVLLKFGSWVEAASLAAGSRDAAFFQASDIRGFRQELEKSGVPVGTFKDLSQMELIISSDGMQTDQFGAAARLLADIKEMFHLPEE